MVPTDLYIQENDEEMMLLARSLSIYLGPLLSPSPLLSLLFDRRFFPLQTYIALYATHTHTRTGRGAVRIDNFEWCGDDGGGGGSGGANRSDSSILPDLKVTIKQ